MENGERESAEGKKLCVVVLMEESDFRFFHNTLLKFNLPSDPSTLHFNLHLKSPPLFYELARVPAD